MIEDKNEICNRILDYLKGRQIGQWTPEDTIEKELAGDIHYYNIRVALHSLKTAGCVDFSKHGSSYQLNKAGQKIMNEGGFKTQTAL